MFREKYLSSSKGKPREHLKKEKSAVQKEIGKITGSHLENVRIQLKSGENPEYEVASHTQ